MPTENWYPISTATHDLPAGMDDWTLGAGANKNIATTVGGGRAGPATHDDATYINEATNGDDQALNIDWPGPMGTWDGVLTANHRFLVSGASAPMNIRFSMVNAGGTVGGTIEEISRNNNGVFENSGPFDIAAGATYRPGAGNWTASDFLEAVTFARFLRVSGPDGTGFESSTWGTASYTPPSGGFAFLLQLAGLGALPFVGALDFSQFMRYLSWRRACHPRHTIMAADEIRRAWDEIRAYRHPKFFLPAVV